MFKTIGQCRIRDDSVRLEGDRKMKRLGRFAHGSQLVAREALVLLIHFALIGKAVDDHHTSTRPHRDTSALAQSSAETDQLKQENLRLRRNRSSLPHERARRHRLDPSPRAYRSD